MKTFVIFCLLTFVVLSNAHKEATDMDEAELAADASPGSGTEADTLVGKMPFEEDAFGESNMEDSKTK